MLERDTSLAEQPFNGESMVSQYMLTSSLCFYFKDNELQTLFYFQLIPMSVLYGVFLFMGVSSMVGVQLIQRILIIFMPPKYQPDYMFLRTVPLRRVHMFTAVQVACLAVLWVIKTIKSISIVFPIMVRFVCILETSLYINVPYTNFLCYVLYSQLENCCWSLPC